MNKLQEFYNDTDIIPAFKTDHSSVLVAISNYEFLKPARGLWKFNNSLIKDETFTNTFKNVIQNMIKKLNNNTSSNNQLKSTKIFTLFSRYFLSRTYVRERNYLENKIKS